MTWTVYLFVFAAYAVGNLPDHSPVWSGVKAVFTAALLILMVRTAHRDITTQYRKLAVNRGGGQPPT
jgi:hypothetical protein